MKLLLDENLSDRIPARIADLFPGSTHVKLEGLARAEDSAIAEWAKRGGFIIVSKDTDFYQRSIVFGHPPKFVWLRIGNCSTDVVVDLLRHSSELLYAFGASEAESLLIVQRTHS